MNPALRSSAAHVFVDDLDAPDLAADDRHHLARVLRLRDGQPVSVGDGRGRWRMCRFAGGELGTDGPVMQPTPPNPLLTVAFSVPKGDRPELVVQKLTELGVDRIVPIRSDRSVVAWDGARAVKNLDRLRRVAREAAMQSRRVWLPVVEPLTAFAAFDAIDLVGTALAEPGGDAIDASVVTIVVGPEGGWSESELARGVRRVSLGPTVLRVETAAIAAGVRICALRDGQAT